MKFADGNFELSRDDASLVGMRPYQIVDWEEMYDLQAKTWTCLWHCLEASAEAGIALAEILKVDETNSYDIWALGKLAVFIEIVTNDNMQNML